MEKEKKPIRIAQILGKLMAGGVEMAVFNYYRAIDKSKFQFDFFYDADSIVDPPQDLIEMGARFYKVPPYQQLNSYLKELNKFFNENKYIIVHSHINTLSVFPLYEAWKCGVPIRIAHNHSVPSGKEFKRNFLKYLLRCFSKTFSTNYFACSEKAGRWMFGDKLFEQGNVIVIKNAVNFNVFLFDYSKNEMLKKDLQLQNRIVIGHVGRFTYAKNHKFLIELFKDIHKKIPNSLLLLVGDGELNQEIHDLVKKFNLSESVVFVGKVSNPENYYPLMDVVVLPSIFEGLSMTTIESQIAGVPIVTSLAVPEEAVISDGCKRLSLDDPEWVNTIIDCIDKKVVLNDKSEEYNIEKAVKKLEKLYTNFIESK